MRGVHDTVALELHPDSIDPGPRKHELEFDARPSVGQERMLVHQVDKVTARHEHVSPNTQIFL